MNEYEVITKLLMINKRLVNILVKHYILTGISDTTELIDLQKRLEHIEMSRL